MAGDLGVRWELANFAGILVDEPADAWHSGHVTDVLEVDEGVAGHLVATETGGVWSIPRTGTAIPLSDDWNSPDVNCLAVGPDGPRHFYAGTGSMYSTGDGVVYGTDVTAGIPLLAWHPLTPTLPAGAGWIHRLLVMPGIRRIIALTADHVYGTGGTGGAWWSPIPAAGGSGSYTWHQAKEIGLPGDGWYDGALGSTRSNAERAELEDVDHVTVIAGGMSGGIAVGRFEGGDLVLRRATVLDNLGHDLTAWWFNLTSPTSVAGCQGNSSRMLAAAANPDGTLRAVFRSDDGGRRWTICGNDVRGSDDGLRASVGDQGKGYNNCVAIHPAVPAVFALGWQNGTFLSADGGDTWLPEASNPDPDMSSPHLHHDVHVLRFLPTREDEHELLIGSDGGLAVVNTDDILAGVNPPRARSDDNRNLPALQCYAPWVRGLYGVVRELHGVRGLYGTLGVGHMADDGRGEPGDVVVSGLQDNGDVAFQLTSGPGPWRKLDGGDGGWSGVMSDGGLVHTIGSGSITQQAARVSRRAGPGFIPLGVLPNGDPGEHPAGLYVIAADTVRRPSRRHRMEVVAAAPANAETGQAEGLYGLIAGHHWERLADLPAGVGVGSVASETGATVFIGYKGSRIFAVDTATGTAIETPVQLPRPFPRAGRSQGTVTRIVALPDGITYAALNQVTFSVPAAPGLPAPSVITSYVLRLEDFDWRPTAWAPFGGLTAADTYVYGLEVVLRPRGDHVVFVAADALVYGSTDRGQTWFRTTTGLPARPHNADLRHLPDRGPQGLGRLYLSTYGRSVWSASMNNLTE